MVPETMVMVINRDGKASERRTCTLCLYKHEDCSEARCGIVCFSTTYGDFLRLVLEGHNLTIVKEV